MNMIRRFAITTGMALALTGVAQHEVAAQVVESRDAEANPASAIFRSTLYGAGTGVVLAGAYTLIREGDNAWDALRWGAGGGAIVGLMIGVIHVATRAEPEEDDGAGLVRLEDGALRFSPRGVLSSRLHDLPDRRIRMVDVHLLAVRF
jgi:hypothetical protein